MYPFFQQYKVRPVIYITFYF